MKKETKPKLHNTELMFQISNALSESEAVCFARTLRQDEAHYHVKVFENPDARTTAKNERFVVVRYHRRGENIIGAYAFWCGKEKLRRITV